MPFWWKYFFNDRLKGLDKRQYISISFIDVQAKRFLRKTLISFATCIYRKFGDDCSCSMTRFQYVRKYLMHAYYLSVIPSYESIRHKFGLATSNCL